MTKLTRKQANNIRRVIMSNLNDELKSFHSYESARDWLYSQYPKYDIIDSSNETRFYCEKWDFCIDWLPAINRWMAR